MNAIMIESGIRTFSADVMFNPGDWTWETAGGSPIPAAIHDELTAAMLALAVDVNNDVMTLVVESVPVVGRYRTERERRAFLVLDFGVRSVELSRDIADLYAMESDLSGV